MPVSPCNAPDGIGYGDVNGSGDVTLLDATMIANYLAGSTVFTTAQMIRADVDGDGVVTQTDADLIKQFVVGSITTFPVCDAVDDVKSFSIALSGLTGEGQITNINAPSSAMHAERVTIATTIKNIGAAIGDFRTQVNAEPSILVRLSVGSSYTVDVIAVMPSSGASVTLPVKCIRIIT